MDSEIINPFIISTLHVLQTLSSAETRPLKLYIKNSDVAKGDITGLMELSGQIDGTISITFTKESILFIVSKMFGEEMKELNDDIKDAVGEISNMIIGQTTQKFVELKKNLKIKYSKVIVGQNHTIPHITKYPILAVPFKLTEGKFILEMAFDK